MDSEPTRRPDATAPAKSADTTGRLTEGSGDFEAAIATAQPGAQEDLRRYTAWAKQLEAEGLVRLQTYLGPTQMITLLPRLRAEGVGLVTIYNDRGNAYLQLWRKVIERNAPELIERIERLLAPTTLRQGNSARNVSAEALAAFTEAYRVAAGRSLA